MQFMGFVNLTPFAAEQMAMMDQNGTDILVYVVKASYAIVENKTLALAEKQTPVFWAAEYFGQPDSSSIKYESEATFAKTATDVVMIGHAHAPGGQATQVDVSLTAGRLSKTIRVYGDRYWLKSLGRWTITKPLPFSRVGLVYEQAFGGWDKSDPDSSNHTFDASNSVGTGFRRPGTPCRSGDKLPNLECPQNLIRRPEDRPQPAGFGFVAPNWQPRIRYAGTYDQDWQSKRMPLLPRNFDLRFFNAAHPGLIAQDYFKGGELIDIINASPKGRLCFNLPQLALEAVVMIKDEQKVHTDMPLDTVIINTDEDLVYLIWRGRVNVHNRLDKVFWAKTQLKEGHLN